MLVVLLALVGAAPALAGQIVRASDYDSYWLWAGVKGRPELNEARSIYLHVGEIGPDETGATRLMAQGVAEPGPHKPNLWLAYRVRSLDWTPDIIAAISRRLAAWRRPLGQVVGIQIDFDASTRGLENYVGFLRDLRRSLPTDCALSVTGLMDWASQAAPEDIDALSGAVDEIVFQTYRGRDTIENIDAYMKRVGRLHIPFRLGLVEGATWSPPASLAQNKYFEGYVIFLRNLPRNSGAD